MSEVKELIGGYSVIQAASLAEATELAKGAPFLQNNPTRPACSSGRFCNRGSRPLTNAACYSVRATCSIWRAISSRSCGVRARRQRFVEERPRALDRSGAGMKIGQDGRDDVAVRKVAGSLHGLDERNRRFRAVAVRHRDGAIQHDHRRGRDFDQAIVQVADRHPVRLGK